MKPHRLYIIMCIFSLLSFAGCRDEEPVQSAESKRTITVNLGIAMSRVVLDDTDLGDDSQPTDMKVWIFNHKEDGSDEILDYAYLQDENELFFSGSDALGELVNTIERIIEVGDDVNELHVYIVMNNQGLTQELTDASTPNDIKTATFTNQKWTEDNKVPIYGFGSLSITEYKKSYSLDIEATRAVGKLELFFTRENANSPLTINSIKLDHVPDKGYLIAPTSYALTYESSIDLLPEERGIDIDAALTTDQASTTGNFSEIYEQDNTTFQRLELEQSYLLENPNGDTWTEIAENHDYVYPEESEIEDKETRYMMTVNYTLGSAPAVDKVVYLPKIVRNEWNKIFVRVKDDGEIVFSYRVRFWEKEESQIGWDPESGFGYAYDAPMAAWRIYEKKVDVDFRDAREGDEEATVCYVLNPRFGRSDNKSDHNTLVAKSSYAGFYFCMTKPKGAIWKACLTNTVDFELSTGGAYDSDGDGENDKHCVITGIAREEPYQIQVGAKNAWTKASEDEGDGYEGADTGWDDLTDWGKQIEDEDNTQYNIHTDLYILVSLDEGITWNTLDINRPDYTPTDKTPEENPEGYLYYLEHTYWHNNRRFAGGNDYIRIWQLKAERGGDFVEMVNKLDDKWAIKAYWKGDDSN